MILPALLWCSQQTRVQEPRGRGWSFLMSPEVATDSYSLLFRRQQEVGRSPHSFRSLSDLPTLSSATGRHSTQRPQTGSEAAAGGSHGGPRHRRPGAYPSRNHPPTDGPGVPTGGNASLPHHRFATAHPDRLPHAGLSDGQTRADRWGGSRSGHRSAGQEGYKRTLRRTAGPLTVSVPIVQELWCQLVAFCWPSLSLSP